MTKDDFNQYLDTLDSKENDEWYCSDREVAEFVFKKFLTWYNTNVQVITISKEESNWTRTTNYVITCSFMGATATYSTAHAAKAYANELLVKHPGARIVFK
jgi:hypothetical protein